MVFKLEDRVCPLLHFTERASGNRRRPGVVRPKRDVQVARQVAHEWARSVDEQPPRRELSIVAQLKERRRAREARGRPWLANSPSSKSVSPRADANVPVTGSCEEAACAVEQEPVSDMEWIMGMTARAVQEFQEDETQAEEQGCVRAAARRVPASSQEEELGQGGIRAAARLVPVSRGGQGGIRPKGRLVPEPKKEPEDCFRRAQGQWDWLVGVFTGVEVRRQEWVSSKPLMPTEPKFASMPRSIRFCRTLPSRPTPPPPNPPTPKAPRMSTRVRRIPTSQLSVPRLTLPPKPKPPLTCGGRVIPPTPPLPPPTPIRAPTKAPVYKSIGACYRAKRKELEWKRNGGEEMALMKRAMAEWYGEESGEEPEEETEEEVSSASSFLYKDSVLRE